MTPTALEPFREARTEQSVRVSISRGPEGLHVLADALDQGLKELLIPVARAGLALVALGSYGRREQCRHSDIDIMLLVTGESADAVNAVLYPLWDTGVRVGHSVRTVEQAIESARANVETLTSLLDARLIAGDATLYARFEDTRRRMLQREYPRMFSALQQRWRDMCEAEPWQLQEPDVKTGRGGLRALQATRWVAQAEAFAKGLDVPPLSAPLAAANATLLTTRQALHLFDDRPNDRMRQDLAQPLADALGVDRTESARRVFAAMRIVDAESTRVFGATDAAARGRWRLPWARSGAPQESVEEPGNDLEMLMRVVRGAGAVDLEPLPPAPWLTRILPEWDVLRSLPHVAPFHLHPVDVHSMRAVAEAKRALVEDADGTGTPTVASELSDHDEVLLAALLHDIGKGHEGDHSHVGAVIAERFSARTGLDPERTQRLVDLVRLHLLLPTVATRRDIADERVIREAADAIGDARTLRLLYLVGVADARATGPDVWSAWKAQLMRTLYLRVLGRLEADAEPEVASVREREEVMRALTGTYGDHVIAQHLRQLPPSYLLSTPPETIGVHLGLIERADGGTAVNHDAVGDVDRVTIVTRDRPGILSQVAGALAVHNVTVLGGIAYTRDDGVAIDVMYVADGLAHGIDERRWGRVLEAIPLALAGEFPIDERLAETRSAYANMMQPAPIPTTVHVDNVGSDAYSIVEVTAADRLGLLYAITHALHGMGLDIHVAKVDTIGREVVDAFYVRRQNGRRIEADDEIERVRRGIVGAVARLDLPPGL